VKEGKTGWSREEIGLSSSFEPLGINKRAGPHCCCRRIRPARKEKKTKEEARFTCS